MQRACTMQVTMLWLILLAGAASAQTPPTAGLQSYFKAREVLDAGVQAIGGLDALRDIRTVHRNLADSWVDAGQGKRPWLGMPEAQDLPAHDGFEETEVSSFLDYQTGRFFESFKYLDAPNDYAIRIDAATGDKGFRSITYVQEKPFFEEFSADDLRSLRLAKFRRYPEGLLRMVLDRPETLARAGSSDEGGRAQEVLSFTDPLGTQIFLYFDAQTRLLTKSETLRDHPVAGDSHSETLYFDYRPAGKLRLPFYSVDRVAGVPTRYLRASSIELDVSLPEERFQPPQDFVRILESPSEPRLQRVGDHLYLIRGNYNVMFAVFRDYVLVIEAPSGSRYAQECLELIRSTAPGKPIRLISTHFHFDHIAGVRTFVAEGIPVLTTPDAKAVIETAVASRRTMHPDALSRNPRATIIEIASAKEVFDDGSQRVELHDFGPAPHVAQILVAYFPREKLLHVADLFDVLTPELVIAGVDAIPMQRKISELGLEVERIIPMHGVPVTIEHLKWGMAIREKYAEREPPSTMR